MEAAIDACIRSNILRDFLTRRRHEVVENVLRGYTEEEAA